MALPLAYFSLCLLFFLPNFYFSCPNPSMCGDVEIHYPFFSDTSNHPSSTATTPDARTGKYSIIWDDDSAPWIKFNDDEYRVMSISYTQKVLILQDQTLGNHLLQGKCGFLYNFTDPIPNFHIPPRSAALIPLDSSVDCQRGTNAFSRACFPELNGSNHCNDYKLYYWDELNDHHVPPSNDCSVPQPTLLEWKLSFDRDNGSLSLLSVGFSRTFELHKDCFNCQTTSQSCTGNNRAANSSYSYVNICKHKGSGPWKKTAGIGSVGGTGLLLICLSVALYFFRRRKASNSTTFCKNNLNKNNNVKAFLEEYGSLAPQRYSYSSVKKITKGFQEKLGKGGFGTVFKGTLSNGHVVAVKILNDSNGDGQDFINEVASIGMTSHVNVVRLLGFCFEGSKRALIYDFMCNGSLEKLLYFEKPKTTVDWNKLFQIAIGIARGLEYLHHGCNTRIVHFDIKPHNILLDQDFCPKISDFGLAKLCLKKDSIISIANARGTIGYIAPEVFSRNFGVVSAKSDVYSYGMMVLEIAGGRKNENIGADNSSEVYFPDWIYKHLDKNGNLSSFGMINESEETVRKLILVGLWCIQTLPQNRPPIRTVVEMLEGSVDDLQIPPKPYISSSQCGLCTGNSSIKDICWDDCSSSANS